MVNQSNNPLPATQESIKLSLHYFDLFHRRIAIYKFLHSPMDQSFTRAFSWPESIFCKVE